MEVHQKQYSFACGYHKLILERKEHATTLPDMLALINFIEKNEYNQFDYLIFIRKEGIERDNVNPLKEGIRHAVQNIISIYDKQLESPRFSTTEIEELADEVTAELYSQIITEMLHSK